MITHSAKETRQSSEGKGWEGGWTKAEKVGGVSNIGGSSKNLEVRNALSTMVFLDQKVQEKFKRKIKKRTD